MRFVLIDRIVGVEPGRAIETLKNVSASEDVFDDHFPGFPIFPGALIIEAFDQSAQLLVALSHGFERLGRLERVTAASFRRPVRPGDQLRLRCMRRDNAGERWTIAATAQVDGQTAARATLQLAIEEIGRDPEARARAERLREMHRVLTARPLDAAAFEAGL